MTDDEPNIIGCCEWCERPIDSDNDQYREVPDHGWLICEECCMADESAPSDDDPTAEARDRGRQLGDRA
jgi:hypothetical protein